MMTLWIRAQVLFVSGEVESSCVCGPNYYVYTSVETDSSLVLIQNDYCIHATVGIIKGFTLVDVIQSSHKDKMDY